jgi:hypothetical protein
MAPDGDKNMPDQLLSLMNLLQRQIDERVSDCSLMPTQQFFSYIIVRTS